MNDPVAHADDLGEWDGGKLSARLGSQPRRRFTGYQEASQDRVLRFFVLKKLFVRLFRDIRLMA